MSNKPTEHEEKTTHKKKLSLWRHKATSEEVDGRDKMNKRFFLLSKEMLKSCNIVELKRSH